MFADGSKPIRVVGGPVNFYEEYMVTTAYVERPLGGVVDSLTVSNDSGMDTVSLSFNGAELEADLKAGESLTLNTTAKAKIYIRGNAGGDLVRIWGW